ncbi:MAG TPA: molybdopterin-binding protein, partial [Anaeromyxobacter sp.]
MGHEEHRREAPRSIRVFVVTASDSRGEAQDEGGAFLRDAAAKAGHEVVGYRIVKDDPDAIRAALDEAARAGAEA